MPSKKLFFLKNAIILAIIMIFSSTEAFAKIKRPHVGNPAKAMKNKAKKAGGSIKKGAAKAGKMAGGLIDKGLRMAGFRSRSADMKKIAQNIKPFIKDIKALRAKPTDEKLLKKLTQGAFVNELKILDEDCLNPLVVGASMVPQVGPFIANICGQVGNVHAKVDAAIDKAERVQAMARDPVGTAAKAMAGGDDSDENENEDDDENE